MKFRSLYRKPEKPDLPQCEAIRKSAYANDHKGTDFQCKWSAMYSVNGKLLCSKHAGAELLKLHIRGEK